MNTSILGSYAMAVLIFIGNFVMPLAYYGLFQEIDSRFQIQAEMRNLVDTVIDTRKLDDSTMSDFNLSMAANSSYTKADITRKVKVVNPKPGTPGETYETYVYTDNTKVYDKGDKIHIEVYAIAPTTLQNIFMRVLLMPINETPIIMEGRVR